MCTTDEKDRAKKIEAALNKAEDRLYFRYYSCMNCGDSISYRSEIQDDLEPVKMLLHELSETIKKLKEEKDTM